MTEDKLWEEILLLQKEVKKIKWENGHLRKQLAEAKLESALLLQKRIMQT